MLLMAASLAAMAQSFTATVPSGQTLTFTPTSGTTVKVDMTSEYIMGALEIPATVSNGSNTYNVTSVANAALNGKGITSLVLPEGMTTIGNSAFSGNNNLASVTLPSTLTAIGSGAFSGTSFFSNPDNLSEDHILYCSNYILGANSAVQGHVVVADGTLGIADFVFLRSSLTSITLPASMRFVGSSAFAYCGSLDTVFMLGENPPSLGSSSTRPSAAVVVSVPCGRLAAYRSAGWGAYTLVENCGGDNPGGGGDNPGGGGDEPGGGGDEPGGGGDEPGGGGDDPNGVASVSDPLPVRVEVVPTGLLLCSDQPLQCTVSDMTGRIVAQPTVCGSMRVELPAGGLYVVAAPGYKPIKVMYLK